MLWIMHIRNMLIFWKFRYRKLLRPFDKYIDKLSKIGMKRSELAHKAGAPYFIKKIRFGFWCICFSEVYV